MTREELSAVGNISGYKVFETFLFGKFYAWIRDDDDNWALEAIEA